MKNLIGLILIIAPFFLFAQEEETRTLSSFHGINVSGSLDAELVKGNSNEVLVQVKNYELDEVKTEVKNGILYLGMKSSNWTGGWKKRQAKVVITYSDKIDAISMSGSTDLIGKGTLEGDRLDIELSGSSDAYLTVDMNSIDARLSGSSDIDMEGNADKITIAASGSSDFEGSDLEVNHADLKAKASSDIYIHVNESIKAIATSSSDIEYTGNPSQKDLVQKASGSISKG